MGLFIKGVEMPTYEQGDLVLRIRWDGRVDKDYSGNTVATAVPVPPHGRLIDANALCRTLRTLSENEYTPEVFANWIDTYTDTIIPADLAEEGE